MIVKFAYLFVSVVAVSYPTDLDGITKIINGFPVPSVELYPWVVGIDSGVGTDIFIKCGGALLDQNTVLTAAHCSEGVKPTSVVVHAHFLSLQDIGKISVQFRVNEIIIHPKYNSQTFNNDVSIWKVSPEFGDTKQLKIYPTLADKTNTYVGNVLTAAGWGRTLNGSATGSDTLREVNLKVLDDTSCQQIYSVIPRNAFCAGSSKVEKVNSQNDTCQGDSGGPLFDQSTPPTIVGIVSNGVDCGSAAGIYADVASLLPWIVETWKGLANKEFININKIHNMKQFQTSSSGVNSSNSLWVLVLTLMTFCLF